jgi:hypothetical protein
MLGRRYSIRSSEALSEIKKPLLRKNYRNAGICNRFFFFFSFPLISSVNEAYQKRMQEFMLEDMQEDDNESERYLSKFDQVLYRKESQVDLILKRMNLPYFNEIMKTALWETFRGELIMNSMVFFISELFGLLYTSMLFFIVKHIRE